MSASDPPTPAVPDENAWPDLSPAEEEELRLAFAEAREEDRRGECIPRDEVLPRLRRTG
jgi:hypothetical protein